MNEPLRVLIFMHCSGLAGAERSVLELIHQLRVEHGVAVSVVLPYEGPMRERLAAEGANTMIVDAGWWCEFDRGRLCENAATLLKAISERPAEFDADVVMTMSITIPWGAIAASVLRKPHVWYLRETGAYLPFVLPLEQVVGVIDESSNAVIALSHAVRRVLASISDCKMSIVPPYFPGFEERAPRAGARKGARPRLIVPGTKSEQKGQEDAIRAVAVLASRGRDVELAIIGPGPESEDKRLAALTAELGVGDRVEISGFRDDILEVMAEADIMVDTTREPALGRVIMEAMLIGTPVVATRSGGAVELCRDGVSGVSYTVGDAADLARAIETVLDEPADTAARVQRAREFARDTNRREKYGAVIYEQLRSLAGSENPTPPVWSGFFLELLKQADASNRAALADAERAIAAHAVAVAERDAANAENQRLKAEREEAGIANDRLTIELDEARAEIQRRAVAAERIATEHDQVVGLHRQLLGEHRDLQGEHEGLHAEYQRLASRLSEEVGAYAAHIAATEATLGWRVLRQLTRVRDRLCPGGTRRRRFYSWIGRTFGPG